MARQSRSTLTSARCWRLHHNAETPTRAEPCGPLGDTLRRIVYPPPDRRFVRPGPIAAVVLTLASFSVVLPAAVAVPQPTCQGVPATIVGHEDIAGTDGDDVIVGSEKNDSIDAKGGDDLVCALGGHDVVWDGPGRDRIYGGKGQDGLWQTSSVDRDVFDGGPNFDAVMYVERTEDMYVNVRDRRANDGQAGEHDRLLSVASITSGSGDDVLIAGTEVNNDAGGFPSGQDYYLVGGDGNDVLIGGRLGELMSGGPGSDLMKGRGGRDYLDAQDTLGGGVKNPAVPEPDIVDGGAGDPSDYAICDQLDTVDRVEEHQGC